MFKKSIFVLSLLAVGSTGFAGENTCNDGRSDREKCIEKTYNEERNRGESHEKAVDHAKEICREHSGRK